MSEISRNDKKAAQAAVEVLLSVLPKSEKGIHDIVYTYGLICREAEIPLEQASAFIEAWGERLRALPDFGELYPRLKKLSRYRYQVRYAVSSAYSRPQDKPSTHRFKTLTGKAAPEAGFWAKKPEGETRRAPRRSAPKPQD